MHLCSGLLLWKILPDWMHLNGCFVFWPVLCFCYCGKYSRMHGVGADFLPNYPAWFNKFSVHILKMKPKLRNNSSVGVHNISCSHFQRCNSCHDVEHWHVFPCALVCAGPLLRSCPLNPNNPDTLNPSAIELMPLSPWASPELMPLDKQLDPKPFLNSKP
jgi:hypothetical protein